MNILDIYASLSKSQFVDFLVEKDWVEQYGTADEKRDFYKFYNLDTPPKPNVISMIKQLVQKIKRNFQ